MAERTTGLMRPLRRPALYSWVQNLLGARAVREHVVREQLRPVPGERILDLGCGPGDLVELLPEVEYLGVDRNPDYIRAASARAHPGAEFRCADVRTVELPAAGFDAVIAVGLMHHLADRDAALVFALAAAALTDGGRLVTVDPAAAADQPVVARYLVARDRGLNVRPPRELARLAEQSFAGVEVECRRGLARVPYTHAVLRCAQPRRSAVP